VRVKYVHPQQRRPRIKRRTARNEVSATGRRKKLCDESIHLFLVVSLWRRCALHEYACHESFSHARLVVGVFHRWCCYGMLWVGTVFSITSVSVCDFLRVFDDDDDETRAGLFCFGNSDSGFVKTSYGDRVFTELQKMGRASGVLAALFLPVALLLFHVAFFVKLPNLTAAKSIWWTVRVLAILSGVFVMLSFSFFHGCDGAGTISCTMGAGAALSAINAVLLTVLTVLLFLVGPTKLPFRCACNCCEEDAVAVATRVDDENTPEAVHNETRTGATTTATTEEEMEDGRLCITTETVDANGNKKITRKIIAVKSSHPPAASASGHEY
jgi:hypothetical protein